MLPGRITKEWFQIYLMQSEIQRKSMVNTAELRQIFPLRENTIRHVVEGDGRYPRAMTPSDHGVAGTGITTALNIDDKQRVLMHRHQG